jgi:hypothetical protein
MSAKQIIKDNQDKLLQILLCKEYQDYKKNCIIDNTIVNSMGDTCFNANYNLLSFDEWIEQILEDF